METQSDGFSTLEELKSYIRENDEDMPRWIFYKHDYEGQNKVLFILYNPTEAQDTSKEILKLCTPKLRAVLRKFDLELPCKDLKDLTPALINMRVRTHCPTAKGDGMSLLPLNKASRDQKDEDSLE